MIIEVDGHKVEAVAASITLVGADLAVMRSDTRMLVDSVLRKGGRFERCYDAERHDDGRYTCEVEFSAGPLVESPWR